MAFDFRREAARASARDKDRRAREAAKAAAKAREAAAFRSRSEARARRDTPHRLPTHPQRGLPVPDDTPRRLTPSAAERARDDKKTGARLGDLLRGASGGRRETPKRGPRATHPGRVALRSVGNAAAATRASTPSRSSSSSSAPTAPAWTRPSSGSAGDAVRAQTSTGGGSPAPSRTSAPAARPPAKPRPGTIAAKAEKSGAEFSSFDEKTRGRALARFRKSHGWTKDADEERVKKVVAMLLAKEHKGYNGPKGPKKKKRSGITLPGPDTPPGG